MNGSEKTGLVECAVVFLHFLSISTDLAVLVPPEE